jgi:hypothetical protein
MEDMASIDIFSMKKGNVKKINDIMSGEDMSAESLIKVSMACSQLSEAVRQIPAIYAEATQD